MGVWKEGEIRAILSPSFRAAGCMQDGPIPGFSEAPWEQEDRSARIAQAEIIDCFMLQN
jgi:hypothetical protein